MALETVEITVNDDQVVPEPVDGVVVRVFDETGTTLITSATTGAVLTGKVQFTLDGDDPPTRYQLRFFVNGGAIRSPQYIDVFSPPASAPTGENNFEIEAEMFVLPPATNPRLCRASGFVWRPDGRLQPGVDMAFIPQFTPIVVEGFGMMGEYGYLTIDLLRTGIYTLVAESQDDEPRCIFVPDRSNINIFHLLYPIVVSVLYTPAGPWNIPLGTELEVTPVVEASDYRTLTGVADSDVVYTTDDPSIASVRVGAETLTIRGNAVGTTTLRVARRDNSINYIPDPGIHNEAITITVS
jgi:hypothetical protein